jgi:undecaprenyl diphosphate synthase
MHASTIERREATTPVRIPSHVAFIMDGNGRWATQRGYPRLAGHRAGVENIRPILRECGQLGIEYVTMYAFSTENWSRPRAEVDGLMLLMGEFIDREGMALHEEGVQVRHLGSLEGIPFRLQRRIESLIDLTRHNTRLTAAVALNYGGRSDVVGAVRSMVVDGLPIEEINEGALASRLSTHGMPDPDLIIRTGGEWRLSNFLVWQAAYSEYWSTQVLWPDFRPECLREAIHDYSRRERRFGGLGNGAGTPALEARGPLAIAVAPGVTLEPMPSAGSDPPSPEVDAAPSEDDEIIPGFASVAEGIAAFAAGKFVLLVDHEERENEGDLAIAAEHVTPDAINFMATHCRGLICMPITGARLDELGIPYMVPREAGDLEVGFTVSVDARGCSTGISAADRALTARALLDPATKPSDLIKPGHLFPLRYTEGGVLRRPGHTEASVDLAKLAGCYPAAVICEVMNTDGTMARREALLAFAARHGITAITVTALIAYRTEQERTAAPKRSARNGTAPTSS